MTSTIATTKRTQGDDQQQMLTIIGFGSLLSETSSRMTFPQLEHFRLGRVPGYRRVFGHVTSPFFQTGIAQPETMEMSSLSAEKWGGDNDDTGGNKNDNDDGEQCRAVPSAAFLAQEEEFDILFNVPYMESSSPQPTLEPQNNKKINQPLDNNTGILCARGTDEMLYQRWGKDYFVERFGQYGMTTIWNWSKDSRLRPCPTYLRHCALAAKAAGVECYQSFLDETFSWLIGKPQ